MAVAECEPLHTWGLKLRGRVVALTREHWIQIAAVLLTAAGMIGLSTWHLSDTIRQMEVAQVQANGALASRLAADEARIDSLSTEMNRNYADSAAFQTRMQGANDTIMQALADLKVQLAGKENMRQR